MAVSKVLYFTYTLIPGQVNLAALGNRTSQVALQSQGIDWPVPPPHVRG
jgi:hypothetical protein